jgi:membrane-bound metal-dependent hydrolase YbcI (DUF457 family)
MFWGYVLGRGAARVKGTQLNIPLLIFAGAIPDLDLFTGQPFATIFGHHGISHSWLAIIVCSIPFFFAYGAGTIPYFAAVIQHPLFGDFVTNEIPLLFPLTLSQTGVNLSETNPAAAIALEIFGFLLFMVVFVMSGDFKRPFAWTRRNLLFLFLWIPVILATIVQSVVYIETDPLTELYAGYAVVSSVTLLGIIALMVRMSSLNRTKIGRSV